jgi:hypothetical protein
MHEHALADVDMMTCIPHFWCKAILLKVAAILGALARSDLWKLGIPHNEYIRFGS